MYDDSWEPAYLGGELLLLNYLHLVGITVLYWDHLLTISPEVDLIWKRSKSLSAYCFFANRYFAFLSGIPVAIIPFLSPSTETCLRLSLFREVAIVVTQLTSGVVMIIRVYALFGRSRRVLWFLIMTAACVVGVSLWSFTSQHASRTLLEGGCHYGLTAATSSRLAGSWEALFAFDSIIFALTIYYAYSAYQSKVRQTTLHVVLVRDGAMYFRVMALGNLTNISTYYLVDYWPFLPGALSTFANCMSVTMISRLLLNLHAHANAGILTEPATATPPSPAISEVHPPMTETGRNINTQSGILTPPASYRFIVM
ncbi:hypothetical protein K438DRAFT_2016246 [Mycena galopus ATCC 62051]|nr:hypothetical protein K438DRAFT_2016246 [Mycena galopus ATCC 62051]